MHGFKRFIVDVLSGHYFYFIEIHLLSDVGGVRWRSSNVVFSSSDNKNIVRKPRMFEICFDSLLVPSISLFNTSSNADVNNFEEIVLSSSINYYSHCCILINIFYEVRVSRIDSRFIEGFQNCLGFDGIKCYLIVYECVLIYYTNCFSQ